MKTLGLILARGGSKGIPGKNVKPFCGKPLIAWSIEEGLKSLAIDNLIVSTDSEEIATIAKRYGASVPFLRPSHLADDKSSSIDAIIHAINFCANKGEVYERIVLLEPTSPLRDSIDIDRAIELMNANPKARSIVGISHVSGAHPDFLVKLDSEQFISFYQENFSLKRRQEIEDLYFFEGSLYISYTNTLIEKKSFYHELTLGYILPKWKSFEIDEPEDFIIAEAIMQAKLAGKFNSL